MTRTPVTLDPEDEFARYFYPVHWLSVGTDKRPAFHGICGYTRRVFTVTPQVLATLIVNDLTVKDGICEEATRCMHCLCPLNRTSMTSFLDGKKANRRVRQELSSFFARRDTPPVNKQPENIALMERLCTEHEHTVVVRARLVSQNRSTGARER